jgi:hypothetical protein
VLSRTNDSLGVDASRKSGGLGPETERAESRDHSEVGSRETSSSVSVAGVNCESEIAIRLHMIALTLEGGQEEVGKAVNRNADLIRNHQLDPSQLCEYALRFSRSLLSDRPKNNGVTSVCVLFNPLSLSDPLAAERCSTNTSATRYVIRVCWRLLQIETVAELVSSQLSLSGLQKQPPKVSRHEFKLCEVNQVKEVCRTLLGVARTAHNTCVIPALPASRRAVREGVHSAHPADREARLPFAQEPLQQQLPQQPQVDGCIILPG